MNQNKTLQKLHIGTFEIRLSQAKIEIETQAKEWKYVIAGGTRPYAEMVNLIARNNTDGVHILCNALYSSTLFFYFPDLCNKWLYDSSEYINKLKSTENEKSKNHN